MSTIVANTVNVPELQSNGIIYTNIFAMDDASGIEGNLEVKWDPDKFCFIEIDFGLVLRQNNNQMFMRLGQGKASDLNDYSWNQTFINIATSPTAGDNGNTANNWFAFSGGMGQHADAMMAGEVKIYLHKTENSTMYYRGTFENYNGVFYSLSNYGTISHNRPDTLQLCGESGDGWNQGYLYVRGVGFA